MDKLQHFVRVLRYIYQEHEKEYLKANAKSKNGMKYEKIKVKKGAKRGRN